MKFILNPKLILGGMMVLALALSSCGKSGETPNNGTNNNNPAISPPTVISIQPDQAFAGDTVTINGTNYSTTLGENSARFNGADATLISATATQLKVKVPQNGSSGPISVKVKNSDYVVSSFNFTYLSPVTVSGFSPTSAAVGKTVTISGTNFSTSLTANTVLFNGTRATVTAATPTQLTVTVPQGATSGPITVTVNKHIATSQAFNVITSPLSTWEEITAPDPVGDVVIAAAVGNVVVYTNISLDVPTGTNNLYKIDNGVVTNLLTSSPNPGTIYSLTTATNAVYVMGSQGIIKSEDGSTWKNLAPAYGSGQFYLGVITNGNQVTVYNGSKAYVSSDKGSTWGNGQAYINPGASSGYNPNYSVYSGEVANNYYYSIPLTGAELVPITRSTDGINWSTTKSAQGSYYYDQGYRDVLAASGDNVFCIYAPGAESFTPDHKRLYKSTDHGDSWTMVSDNKVNTIKASGNYVMYGYDSLNLSTDNGNTFTNYAIPTGYTIGGLQKAGNYIYIFCTSGSTHKIFRSSL